MPHIIHRIGIKTDAVTPVLEALTTIKGLAGWWTTDTSGEPEKKDGTIQFRFGAGGFDMRVTKLQAPNEVEWEVIALEKEWIGTTIHWQLKQEGDYVIVLFQHRNWKDATEFMHHCSTKWAVFLLSLKALFETGKGAPNPNDQKIDNWNWVGYFAFRKMLLF